MTEMTFREPRLAKLDGFRVEIDRPFDQGTVTFRDLAQTYGSFIANGRYQLRREVCRKRQRFNTGIGQRMDGVGMGGKALADPKA